MKKRLLAAVMSLCVIVSLLPVSVLAAGEHQHNIADDDVEIDASCGNDCPGHIITGSSTGGLINGAHKIVVDGGTHTIILNGVYIEPERALGQSAMDITGGANVTLVLKGKNTLIGNRSHPGIWVDDGTTLTIEGDGSLYAAALNGTASTGAAGIGSGSGTNTNFGDITINSGVEEAYGTVGGGGIGGG